MAIISKGTTFLSGQSVTANDLNTLVDSANFVAGASGTTDNTTLEVHGSGYLQVKDDGITNGKIATDKDLLGKFVLVYFGFTHCPDICPNELVKIGTIMDSLESNQSTKGKVEPVFISIDPRRDTVGQMERYRHDFHPKIRYLTGTPDQVTRVAKLFRVYWSKVDEVVDDDDEEDYSVDHTIVLYLMGPDGKFIDLFTQSVETKAILSKINDIVSNHQEA